MARLNVQAAVRWASGSPNFRTVGMLLALSVTDQDGAKVEHLDTDNIHVGYQERPDPVEDTLALISDFHRYGPTVGGTGWYSCIVKPQSPGGWVQNEVLLCVTVRHTGNRGQTILLARYHQIPS
jgi:hypothetical protein